MKHLLMVCLLTSCLPLWAQDSTRVKAVTPADTSIKAPSDANDLLAELSDSTADAQELLPRKMVFTQRAFWGPKGLLRLTHIAPLTPQGREKELKIRRTFLVSHQVMGFVTLAGFIAQGILGGKLYKAKGADYLRIHDQHENMATLINFSYGTTALLSLTSPPGLPTTSRKRGFSSIKLHRALAVVHLTGMVATNILAHQIDKHPNLKPYHRASAYTTFGAYAAAIIAIKLK
ncbi:hypothetical protein GCM10028803_58400 [Larkinella knui]|uniref:Cytochrome b561 bacterial/Ni-hydrogenase domain-containing protein n=1 Tax=Larkinella knui TaxID=2025310 RepID=A0A3P1CAD5_9BACT|nr:hypothetical protein [Larkinella knui]RRB10205.1 hypothetical protein EHT87_28595 [Larkinella knui]